MTPPPLQRPADAIAFASLKRVLVVMLRHHGDVLLTSPVHAALKRAVPHVEVDALIYRETLPILAFSPELAKVHTIDRAWKKSGSLAHARAELRLLGSLRERRYDLVVHLTDHRRGAWLVRALAPRYSVAPRLRHETGIAARFWKASFTHRYANASSVAPGSALARRHTVDQNLDALRRLGLAIDEPPRLAMTPGDQGESDATALLARLGVDGPFIAMQPTSRWLFKCWSVASNAALIASLLRRGETLVLSCAPDDRERAMIAAIVAAIHAMPGVPLERLKIADDGGTLNRLAALIARATLFVGIDSAPMHIAAAMGTPVVALFGPSGEFNWGPWRVPQRIVTSDAYSCRPCGQDGCGGGKVSDCLVRLPVGAVLDAIDDLVREVAGS
ncbi:MAG: putative lipopolysaccharide heptosyltransferase III, partial [Burkholderiaceae bacterium]